MKKILLLCLLLLMSSISTFAEDIIVPVDYGQVENTSYNEEDLKHISYDEAVAIALENNSELVNLVREMEVQEVIITEVASQAKYSIDHIYDEQNDDDRKVTRATQAYLDPVVEDIELAVMKRNYEEKVFEIEKTILSHFIEYNKEKAQLDVSLKIKEISEIELEQVKLKKSLDLVTDKDLLLSEYNLANVSSDVTVINNAVNLRAINFNILVTGDTKVVYLPTISDTLNVKIDEYVPLSLIDIDKLVNNNISNDSTIKGYNEQIEISNAKIDIEKIYTEYAGELLDYQDEIEDSKSLITRREHDIYYDAHIAYYDLKNLLLDIEVAFNNVNLAKLNLNDNKVKYDLGMIIYLDVVKYEKDLIAANNTYLNSLNAYYNAYYNFIRHYHK